MTRVLVAYPDPQVVDRVVRATRAWHFDTSSITDPSQLLSLALRRAPDVVIMGHHLPHDTAVAVRELRDLVRTSVIALAPAAFDHSKLVAAGVERVVSPWAPRMVLRRAVKWVLAMAEADRRYHAAPTLRLGPVTFMPIASVLLAEGRGGLRLTRTEAALLRALAARCGEVVLHHELIKAAWPRVPNRSVPRTRMQVHIHNLRRKLGQVGAGAPTIELSCWNGYRLLPKGEVTVIRLHKVA